MEFFNFQSIVYKFYYKNTFIYVSLVVYYYIDVLSALYRIIYYDYVIFFQISYTI